MAIVTLEQVLQGLRQRPKKLPADFLYDPTGVELHSKMAATPPFYLSRTETSLLRANATVIADKIGQFTRVIEPECKSPDKTVQFLSTLREPLAYLPVNNDRFHLNRVANAVKTHLPSIDIRPLPTTFDNKINIPFVSGYGKTAIFLPDSYICSLEPVKMKNLLISVKEVSHSSNIVLVSSADSTKNAAILHRAYDDEFGAAERFSLNAISRLNREFGGNLDKDLFFYRAWWEQSLSRVELHLVPRRKHQIIVGKNVFNVSPDEHIITEVHYKYDRERMRDLLLETGWNPVIEHSSNDNIVKLWICDKMI